jgi:PASTA domain
MKLRRKMIPAATFLCALVTSLALAAPAAAEPLGPAPIRNLDEGGMSFQEITGPEAPEEYPFRVDLGEEQFMEQVSPTEVDVEYGGHHYAFSITAEEAHDAVGTAVPTTLELTGREEVTLTVHHREGNPIAEWAPFDYPIISGSGWAGGFRTIVVPMENPLAFAEADRKIIEANPPAAPEPPPVITCKVPTLHGYSLRGAKNRLRAAHCGIGAVHLAADATVGKGKVVKQFHVAGTELAAGAPVAVKLAPAR